MTNPPYPLDTTISEMLPASAFVGGDLIEISKLVAPFTYGSRYMGYNDFLRSVSGDISTLPNVVSGIKDDDIFHVAIQETSGAPYIPYKASALTLMNYINQNLTPLYDQVDDNTDLLDIKCNDIVFLSGEIDGLSADLLDLEDRVDTNTLVLSALIDISGSLSATCCIANSILIASLSSDLLDTNDQVAQNTADIATLQSEVDDLSGRDSNFMLSIGTVEDGGSSAGSSTRITSSSIVSSQSSYKYVWDSIGNSVNGTNWGSTISNLASFADINARKTIIDWFQYEVNGADNDDENNYNGSIVIDWENDLITGTFSAQFGAGGTGYRAYVLSSTIGTGAITKVFTRLGSSGEFTIPAITIDGATKIISALPYAEVSSREADMALQYKIENIL
jgi:hypothetical protein